MLGLFGCGDVPDVKNTELISYRYSSYGGMCGGGSYREINIVDDRVILTDSHTTWWYEDACIKEYELEPAVLTDIESIFRKYKMQEWNNKKFTNEFVADGESNSYVFKFEDGTSVSFSSQTYPKAYGKKLSAIHDVITEHLEKGTLEPGLVTREKTEEELMYKEGPDNGLVELEVYEYSIDRIYYRILNGTDENVEVSDVVKLVRNSDGEVLYDNAGEYSIEVDATTSDEEIVFLSGRLAEGAYTLYVGEYSTEFEIRVPND